MSVQRQAFSETECSICVFLGLASVAKLLPIAFRASFVLCRDALLQGERDGVGDDRCGCLLRGFAEVLCAFVSQPDAVVEVGDDGRLFWGECRSGHAVVEEADVVDEGKVEECCDVVDGCADGRTVVIEMVDRV